MVRFWVRWQEYKMCRLFQMLCLGGGLDEQVCGVWAYGFGLSFVYGVQRKFFQRRFQMFLLVSFFSSCRVWWVYCEGIELMRGQNGGVECGEGWVGEVGEGGLCRVLLGFWNFKQRSYKIGFICSLESGRQGWRQEDQIDRGGLF